MPRYSLKAMLLGAGYVSTCLAVWRLGSAYGLAGIWPLLAGLFLLGSGAGFVLGRIHGKEAAEIGFLAGGICSVLGPSLYYVLQ